jgi:hypothetical protein
MIRSDLSVFSDLSDTRKALASAGLLFLAACSSSTGPSSTVPLDTEFQLAPGQTAVVGTSGLRILFESVPLDSRCPMGVLCIVAGEAQVQISARQGAMASTLTLKTDGLGRQAVFLSYSVELMTLTPPPRLNQPTPPASYRAGFKVSVLGPD